MCSGCEIDGVVIISDEVCVGDSDVMFFLWLIGKGVVIDGMGIVFNIFDTSSKICGDRRGVFAYLCFASQVYAWYLQVCLCLAACP